MNPVGRVTRSSTRRLLATRQKPRNVDFVGILRTNGKVEASGNRAFFSLRRKGPVRVESWLIPHREDDSDSFWYDTPPPRASTIDTIKGKEDSGIVGILRTKGKVEASGNQVIFSSRRNKPVRVERRLVPHRVNALDTFWYKAPQPLASILKKRGDGDDDKIQGSKLRFSRGDGLVDVKLIPETDESWFLELGSLQWVEDGVNRRRSCRLLAQQRDR